MWIVFRLILAEWNHQHISAFPPPLWQNCQVEHEGSRCDIGGRLQPLFISIHRQTEDQAISYRRQTGLPGDDNEIRSGTGGVEYRQSDKLRQEPSGPATHRTIWQWASESLYFKLEARCRCGWSATQSRPARILKKCKWRTCSQLPVEILWVSGQAQLDVSQAS